MNNDLEFDFKAYLRKKEQEKMAKENPQMVEEHIEVCPECGEPIEDCVCDDENEEEVVYTRPSRRNETRHGESRRIGHRFEEEDDEYELPRTRYRDIQERRMQRFNDRMDEKFLEEEETTQQVQQPQVVVLQQPQVEEVESENDKIMKEIEKSKNELKKYIDVIFCQYGSTGLKRLEALMKKDLSTYFSTGVNPEEKVEKEEVVAKEEPIETPKVEQEEVVEQPQPMKKKVMPFKAVKPQPQVEEEVEEEQEVSDEDALMASLCDTESSVSTVNQVSQEPQQVPQPQYAQQQDYNNSNEELSDDLMSDLIGFESNYHPNSTPNNAPINPMQNNPMAQTYNPTQTNNTPVGYAQPQEEPQEPNVEQQVEQPTAPQKVTKVKRTKKKVQ